MPPIDPSAADSSADSSALSAESAAGGLDWARKGTLRVTCARGLDGLLREELRSLGYEPAAARDPKSLEALTGVEVEGSLLDAGRLNLCLRTAYHVLYRVGRARCSDPEDLYEWALEFPWEAWIPADGYLSVVTKVRTPSVSHSRYPSLKLKDAIVDRISERCGRRPDAGPMRDGCVVTLHWFGEEAILYLDASGRKLSDRGYRQETHDAPLRESLAAGIVLATGYDGSTPFVNPMCGSGTLAIEAALIASGRAPGLLRHEFATDQLLGFDSKGWQALRAELRTAGRGREIAPIIASDLSPDAIDMAERNARTAGVDHLITFETCPVEETTVPEGAEGHVLLNPPYGERLGDEQALAGTYKLIGDFFKQRCQGYTGWVFTANRGLLKKVGLRASRKRTFFNGELECRLARFLLYKGRHEGRAPRRKHGEDSGGEGQA